MDDEYEKLHHRVNPPRVVYQIPQMFHSPKTWDDEYEKLHHRVNPPRAVIDNESCKNATVRESWLDVQLCQDGLQDCRVSNETTQHGVLRFPKHSNEETINAVFSLFKDVKVIQFSSVQNAFEGFSDKALLFDQCIAKEAILCNACGSRWRTKEHSQI